VEHDLFRKPVSTFRDHALILRLGDKLFNEAVSLPEFNDVMAFGRLLSFPDGLLVVGTGENSHAYKAQMPRSCAQDTQRTVQNVLQFFCRLSVTEHNKSGIALLFWIEKLN
jgi:hypothetical protein